jgi:hypothetical protein
MASEIEEIVSEGIEEIAVDDVIDEQHGDGGHAERRPRWELWVALSSSLLAVLSAIAALLATFASDEAAVALSDQTDYAAYAEAVTAGHTILKAKLDILSSLGDTPSKEDIAELDRLHALANEFRERGHTAKDTSEFEFKVHDRLAIGVTLFQVTMLLGGLSIMVQRRAIWHFGLLFTLFGMIFFIYGVFGYIF